MMSRNVLYKSTNYRPPSVNLANGIFHALKEVGEMMALTIPIQKMHHILKVGHQHALLHYLLFCQSEFQKKHMITSDKLK